MPAPLSPAWSPSSLRPLQQAAAVWRRWNPSGAFTALLAGYLTRGFVYSGDDAFILAMPQNDDTWFVHLAAGDPRRFQQLAPYRLPWIAWQRRGGGPVRRWSWERFERLVNSR